MLKHTQEQIPTTTTEEDRLESIEEEEGLKRDGKFKVEED
jgi:hypothetical protein